MIRGYYHTHKNQGKRILVSPIEHASVSQTCNYLRDHHGAKITYIPVDKYGVVILDDLKALIKKHKDIIMCLVMACNNEIGTIEPIKQIGELCHRAGIHFHCDATQYVGHYPLFPKAVHVDSLTFSGHKIHGPRGIGALYLREGTEICPCFTGGRHEFDKRPSTETPYLIGGLECSLRFDLSNERYRKVKNAVTIMRNYMRDRLIGGVPGIVINGHPTKYKFNTLSICIPGINSRDFIKKLNKKHICVNVGSACSLGNRSKVLEAIGVPLELEKGVFRISLSEYNTMAECRRVCDTFIKLYHKITGRDARKSKPRRSRKSKPRRSRKSKPRVARKSKPHNK